MGKPDAPAPPDPRQTSAAQTGTNVGTAIANSVMGMVDQYTPYGNLTYSLRGGEDISNGTGGGTAQPTQPAPQQPQQPMITLPNGMRVPARQGGFAARDGGNVGQFNAPSLNPWATTSQPTGISASDGSYLRWTDDYTGQTYDIPRFESRIELTPIQQETLDSNFQAQKNLADLASDRSGFLLDYLPQTESLTDQIGNRLYDMGSQRLDPRFAREEEALRTRLANQGIGMGTEAYNRELEALSQSKNDAYNQLMLQGRGQAMNEINAPINQITALLSGSQVQNPNVQMQQPARIPTTDVAGIINNNYAQQMNAWNVQNQQSNSMLGGLFGAGASLLSAPAGSIAAGWSDRRLKKDIELVKPGEFNTYAYRYVWDSSTEPKRLGYMAQEVIAIKPEAVFEQQGYLALDYAKLPEVSV